MAKHKKPAPAAKKTAAKPAAKPAAAKPAPKKAKPVPAKKPESAKPAPEKKPAVKAQKPAPKPAPKPVAKEQAASKSRPPIPAPEKASTKTAPEKAPEKKSSKTTPPLPTKTTPPIESKPSSGTKAAPAPVKTAKAAKADARELLRNRILGAKKGGKPIAFTLEEAREIAKTVAVAAPAQETPKAAKAAKVASAKTDLSKIEKPATPNHVKAASLADILGFNPKKTQKPANDLDPEDVPEKYRRYYKLLLDLRGHLTEGLTLHTEETLKRSAKDDAGDLSSYGQHMADAGTDTFDRDFALSLVSSEQEALTEIDSAIKRIKDGTYGVCEVTGKPIAKERLTAVPFTRYSAEAQKDIEKNRMRTRTAAGLFGEIGEEGGRIAEDDGGGDD
ncbi:TraR/DksA family transcriptional regulator [Nibricoccus sp. IMCC34717]|uniref:TraR/DksA family transcriptional regulator n=1 Tax=Nibricoccus sp. IMCC34717 TaxID=3034021 RepID=UPI00384AC3B9